MILSIEDEILLITEASDNNKHDKPKHRTMTSTCRRLTHADGPAAPALADPRSIYTLGCCHTRPHRYPTRTALRPSADKVSMVNGVPNAIAYL